MSRLWHSGFEWQSLTAGVELSAINGGTLPTIDTSVKHSGAASLKVSGNITTTDIQSITSPNVAASTTFYARAYVKVTTMPNDANVVWYLDVYTGTTNVISAQFSYNGTNMVGTIYYNNFGANLPDAPTFSTGAWHYVEIFYNSTPADASEVLTVKIDGTTVATSSAITYTNKTVNNIACGVYNGTASTISTEVVNIDDLAINNGSGSVNNSYPGAGNIVISVPNGAGDNAATTGVYSYINEVPPTDTATSGSTMIELDSNGVIADYAMQDSSTIGIDSYDTITAILVLARVREEAAGTSSYQLRIKSASGGTVSSTTAADAGNATARTNPNGTTAFGRLLVSETDPTTGSAWTPTGTNSIDNMQIGAKNVDADSTPDLWITAMGAMIEYVDGTPPASGNAYRMRMGMGL